jgi:predicted enzyme related to lactoylglutathione lyase
MDAGPSDGGSGQVADTGTAPDATPGEIPAPVAAPYIWGFGIGVTDLPGAVKFYSDVMKMTVEKDGIKRDDRTETILNAVQAKRGAHLVLMKFDDGRPTRKITAKIVWQASNPGAINTAASKYPDYASRVNFGIVQFDGPETYIQEVGSIFDSGGNGITVPYPIALGFSVSDLAASRKFYMALGMSEESTGSFPVTDATGSATITEWTVKWSTGSACVLQNWSTPRNSKDNPVKVIFFVPDAKAMADKVVAAGGSLLKPAERIALYDNRLVIVAKDRDGYLLDLVQ